MNKSAAAMTGPGRTMRAHRVGITRHRRDGDVRAARQLDAQRADCAGRDHRHRCGDHHGLGRAGHAGRARQHHEPASAATASKSGAAPVAVGGVRGGAGSLQLADRAATWRRSAREIPEGAVRCRQHRGGTQLVNAEKNWSTSGRASSRTISPTNGWELAQGDDASVTRDYSTAPRS
jgi:hypothetical protein